MTKNLVHILEVGARDGLQNEPGVVSTPDKIALINRAVAAGIRRLEVASFVHPGRVPQMADAEAVVAGLPEHEGVSYIGLVLNKKGALRALATRVHELGCVVVATDSFGQKNQGQTIVEGIAAARDILRLAHDHGRRAQVTIAASFGCPFEGEVPAERVLDIAEQLAEAGPIEIALADTIGVGVPAQVHDLFGQLRERLPDMPLRAHFHNTRNTGIANAMAAIEEGVVTLDASLGGIGGCPFAPKATGNIATEDLLYLLDRSGLVSGVDLDQVIASAHWLADMLGRPVPGLVSKAGGFPKPIRAE
ncbi:hydroxymethylglutaryl-CoA lyase [Govanella unica]|uniref:Hydroxymethylglutaryl-CoA lyase n=1 Tax=Govanella unica TaxID=2975056 RepID=A0A9X3Z7R4_9PROT|nr:hydroxymethylglutaryl-CoA lyase [Govania unica]MDA5194462.1 hydroxymethylglutaryl-CoA lyase [Govania unica]